MKFIATEDALTIKFQGFEVLFGLRKKLVLPRKDIENLEWTPEFNYSGHLLRVGGTGLPKLMFSGYFRDLETKQLFYLYVHKPKGGLPVTGKLAAENVLLISMRAGKCKQVIMSCEPEIGAALTKWWRNI